MFIKYTNALAEVLMYRKRKRLFTNRGKEVQKSTEKREAANPPPKSAFCFLNIGLQSLSFSPGKGTLSYVLAYLISATHANVFRN